MRPPWPRRQHRRLASWLSTVRKPNSSRFGLTPTSYATDLPLALSQLQSAPIRTPRRRRKTMMLQAFAIRRPPRDPRSAPAITPGTPCHGSRPKSEEKRSFSRSGAAKWSLVDKAPRRPRFILVHTSHGPEGRLAHPCGSTARGACRLLGHLLAARGDGLHGSARQLSIIAANNALQPQRCS